MIPNNFKHRVMFEFLYDFAVRGKYMFYIFLLYVFLLLFNNVSGRKEFGQRAHSHLAT